MTKTATKTVNVLETLQKSREHINTMWVHGAWFSSINPENPDEKDKDSVVNDGWKVTGVCAAGSVLYSLDYTDEQWSSQDDVVPVIEALFSALPPTSKAVRQYRETNVLDYDSRLGAVIEFNDARGRRKADVLAVFDRAIDNAVAAQSITIPEFP